MIRHTTNLLLMGSLFAFGIVRRCEAGTLDDAIDVYQSAMESSDRTDRLNGFQRAELLFRKAIDDAIERADGNASAELYSNLGTACLSAERIGPAILAYRKALLIDPSHKQSVKNLSHARELLPEWSRWRESEDLLERMSSIASRRMLFITAAICFFTSCLFLAGAIGLQSGFMRLLAVFPFTAWVGLLAFVFFIPSDKTEGVVIRDDVVARSADSNNSSKRFVDRLPSGAEVVVLGEREEWLQISLAERTAWVPRSAVAIIALP